MICNPLTYLYREFVYFILICTNCLTSTLLIFWSSKLQQNNIKFYLKSCYNLRERHKYILSFLEKLFSPWSDASVISFYFLANLPPLYKRPLYKREHFPFPGFIHTFPHPSAPLPFLFCKIVSC